MGYECRFCLCFTENQAQLELHNQDASLILLFVTFCVRQLRHRTLSSTVFLEPLSVVVKYSLFCFSKKWRETRGFDYKPVLPNLTATVSMATVLWGPKVSWEGVEAGLKNSHTPDTCAQTHDAQGWDVMEMTDKTVEIKSPCQACVHLQGWDPQASASLLRRDGRPL